MSRVQPIPRNAYLHFAKIQTRWNDNDVYGHINNVVYYEYFDTVINAYLIEAGALDTAQGNVIGLVVETHCNYFAPSSYPEKLEAGIRVSHIGSSSVRYEIGIFTKDKDVPSAQGHFVHVYVDASTRKPASLPEVYLQALRRIQV